MAFLSLAVATVMVLLVLYKLANRKIENAKEKALKSASTVRGGEEMTESRAELEEKFRVFNY